MLTGVVTSVLHDAEASGARGALWFVTLTFRPSELDEAWPWQAADLYAHAVAREGHPAGALLALDVSRADRRHFHGLVLSHRTPLELDRVWYQLGKHAPIVGDLYQRVKPVTGARDPWPSAHLVKNLRRILGYLDRARDWPRDVPKPDLTDRLITSGPFAAYLATTLPATEAPDLVPLVAARLHARLQGQCEGPGCGAPLPADSRARRRTCSRRCRVRKHRQDRATAAT